jgi:palmitoyltransferase
MLVPGPIALTILGVYTFSCIFFIYFCILADARDSEIAYFVQFTLPNASWNRLSRICGDNVMRVLKHVSHRTFVILYFTVVGGSWSVVFLRLYPWLLYDSPGVSNMHAYYGVFVFLACFGAWAVANASHPGMITGRSFRRYDHYPYDDLLFQANIQCHTTKLYKIPRSKFDRMKYGGLVPRYDHYCGWTHNTYGEENYRWFLLFLLNHVVMCFYGTYCSYLLFADEIRRKRLMELTFFDRQTGETLQATKTIIFQYIFARRSQEVGVTVVMAVMGIALTCFLGYHVYITSMGQTTNENGKWGDVRAWYKKQKKLYQTAVREGRVPKNPIDTTTSYETEHESDEDSEEQKSQEIVDPGPIPKNQYNRGFAANWSEVLFPLSLRKDALSDGGYTAAIIKESQRQNNSEVTETNTKASSSSIRSKKPKDI